MCGIAGILSTAGDQIDPFLVARMTQSLRHRGPDDEGYLFANVPTRKVERRRGSETIPEMRGPDIGDAFPPDFRPNLGMGWRRLSIIDLSPSGHQPMSVEDESIWIIFNGEIYNYLELREELRAKGHHFRTLSDTEVLLESYREWGLDCIHRLNGMWGFALYDRNRQLLFCARDRFGIKPFYYSWDGNTFSFGSEIKALLEAPTVPRGANDAMVRDFLMERVLDHTDQTFFESIQQLRPGHFLTVGASGLQVKRYYTLDFSPELGSFDEAACRRHAEEFRELFNDSVRLHLRSDVTIGSCLSGGLDSSSIVTTANDLIFGGGVIDRSLVGEKQKTFTATYDDKRFSEDHYVQLIIKKTNAAAHFVHPSAQGLGAELRQFIRAQDEPTISTSMYAQWNVMKLAASQRVKVLLDGQGGDELLAGYRWHYPIFHGQLFSSFRWIQLLSERRKTSSVTGQTLRSLTVPLVQKMLKRAVPRILRMRDQALLHYLDPEFSRQASGTVRKSDLNLQQRLWEEETQLNLQQLLHYEDRNSMAFSIEARVPFINHRLVEYVMNVPAVYKIHHGWSKYLLRRAMEGFLPSEIQWRRDKMGFVTPEDEWITELRPQFSSLLREGEYRSGRYVRHKNFLAHLQTGSTNLSSGNIWRLVSLELWMREFQVS